MTLYQQQRNPHETQMRLLALRVIGQGNDFFCFWLFLSTLGNEQINLLKGKQTRDTYQATQKLIPLDRTKGGVPIFR
jgi:hypothetical protein